MKDKTLAILGIYLLVAGAIVGGMLFLNYQEEPNKKTTTKIEAPFVKINIEDE